MSQSLERVVFWTPRVISMLFIVFLSLFALDVFGQGYSWWETLLGLFMHLIPTFILILVLVFSWRREWIGALLFFGFGCWYIISAWGIFDWSVYLVMAGPPMLVGLLFGASWIYKTRTHVT